MTFQDPNTCPDLPSSFPFSYFREAPKVATQAFSHGVPTPRVPTLFYKVGGEVVGRKYETKIKIRSDLGQDDKNDVSSDSRISRRGSDPLNRLVDSVSIDGKQNQNQILTNSLASQVLPAAGDVARAASFEYILGGGSGLFGLFGELWVFAVGLVTVRLK